MDEQDLSRWDHIWVIDAVYGVLCNAKQPMETATTTMKDGFSMEFILEGGSVLCSLIHFGGMKRLDVSVNASPIVWYALKGVAGQYNLEFGELIDASSGAAERQ